MIDDFWGDEEWENLETEIKRVFPDRQIFDAMLWVMERCKLVVEGAQAYFVCPMDAPGIEIRPLKQMTGGASFNEVFFTDARVAHEILVAVTAPMAVELRSIVTTGVLPPPLLIRRAPRTTSRSSRR